MNEIAVFLDTTLIVQEAMKILPGADYFSSVKKGDVLDIIKGKYKIIVIIDGSFNWSASVWHKEILIALNKGLLVFGCSSMGALRASELDSFGMIGHGEIYLMYKSCMIDGDDEVAISYNTQTNEKTIPLVNIRKTLNNLSLTNSEQIIDDCRDIFYINRTWSSLKRNLDDNTFDVIYRNYIDLKKIDAISLLTKIKCELPSLMNKSYSEKHCVHTFFEKEMIEEKYGVMFVDFARSLPEIDHIERVKIQKAKGLLKITDTKKNKENLYLFYKLVCFSSSSGYRLDENYVVDLVFRFREERDLLSGEQFCEWTSKKYLSTADLLPLFHDYFLIKKLYKVNFNYKKYFL